MKLLKSLYGVWSGSRKEEPMRKFICNWVRKNVKGVEVSIDKVGNVLVVKGKSDTYPCIVAHMDQVQQKYPEGYQLLCDGFVVSAIDIKTRERCGLGADDKNGIWIALNALKKYDVMKCAFFVNEESGFTGSNGIDMEWFNDCRWVIQCDRKGYQDFINHTNGVEVCNDKFIKACNLKSHRYEKCTGMATDVGILKRRGLKVCAVNLSCGYYDAHRNTEYTVIPDLMKCQKLVEFMVEKLTDVYSHENKPIQVAKPMDYSSYHRPWGSNAFSMKPKTDEEGATEVIVGEMERKYRAKYDEFDDAKIEEIAKKYYNSVATVYNVSLNYCIQTVKEVVSQWAAEDYQEERQMLSDSISDMYDSYVEDIVMSDESIENVDDLEAFELSDEQEKQFIIDTAAQCVESYPTLSGKDVVDAYNDMFGASVVYDDVKEEIDEAVTQAKVELAERVKAAEEAKAKREEEERKKNEEKRKAYGSCYGFSF